MGQGLESCSYGAWQLETYRGFTMSWCALLFITYAGTGLKVVPEGMRSNKTHGVALSILTAMLLISIFLVAKATAQRSYKDVRVWIGVLLGTRLVCYLILSSVRIKPPSAWFPYLNMLTTILFNIVGSVYLPKPRMLILLQALASPPGYMRCGMSCVSACAWSAIVHTFCGVVHALVEQRNRACYAATRHTRKAEASLQWQAAEQQAHKAASKQVAHDKQEASTAPSSGCMSARLTHAQAEHAASSSGLAASPSGRKCSGTAAAPAVPAAPAAAASAACVRADAPEIGKAGGGGTLPAGEARGPVSRRSESDSGGDRDQATPNVGSQLQQLMCAQMGVAGKAGCAAMHGSLPSAFGQKGAQGLLASKSKGAGRTECLSRVQQEGLSSSEHEGVRYRRRLQGLQVVVKIPGPTHPSDLPRGATQNLTKSLQARLPSCAVSSAAVRAGCVLVKLDLHVGGHVTAAETCKKVALAVQSWIEALQLDKALPSAMRLQVDGMTMSMTPNPDTHTWLTEDSSQSERPCAKAYSIATLEPAAVLPVAQCNGKRRAGCALQQQQQQQQQQPQRRSRDQEEKEEHDVCAHLTVQALVRAPKGVAVMGQPAVAADVSAAAVSAGADAAHPSAMNAGGLGSAETAPSTERDMDHNSSDTQERVCVMASLGGGLGYVPAQCEVQHVAKGMMGGMEDFPASADLAAAAAEAEEEGGACYLVKTHVCLPAPLLASPHPCLLELELWASHDTLLAQADMLLLPPSLANLSAELCRALPWAHEDRDDVSAFLTDLGLWLQHCGGDGRRGAAGPHALAQNPNSNPGVNPNLGGALPAVAESEQQQQQQQQYAASQQQVQHAANNPVQQQVQQGRGDAVADLMTAMEVHEALLRQSVVWGMPLLSQLLLSSMAVDGSNTPHTPHTPHTAAATATATGAPHTATAEAANEANLAAAPAAILAAAPAVSGAAAPAMNVAAAPASEAAEPAITLAAQPAVNVAAASAMNVAAKPSSNECDSDSVMHQKVVAPRPLDPLTRGLAALRRRRAEPTHSVVPSSSRAIAAQLDTTGAQPAPDTDGMPLNRTEQAHFWQWFNVQRVPITRMNFLLIPPAVCAMLLRSCIKQQLAHDGLSLLMLLAPYLVATPVILRAPRLAELLVALVMVFRAALVASLGLQLIPMANSIENALLFRMDTTQEIISSGTMEHIRLSWQLPLRVALALGYSTIYRQYGRAYPLLQCAAIQAASFGVSWAIKTRYWSLFTRLCKATDRRAPAKMQ